MHRCLSLLSVLVLSGVFWTEANGAEFTMPQPPGPHCPVSAEQLKEVESYPADRPLVGTHFFYWYDVESKAHFVDYDGSDALTDHPTHREGYSYKSVAWWKRELVDVTAAGIDFILPVYWGCPGAYDSWSFVGLPPLVRAWEELDREGKEPPRVGLFYDTSTLRHNPRRWHVDLSTAAGKRWFYATIRDFFSFIPPKMWMAIEGRPIVVLYSPSFAAKQDPALFPFVREQFKRDFATDMFLAKNLGWEGEADTLCSWGGALGLKAYGFTSLGPGYDHSAVPRRKPLVVDRQEGAFYEGLWKQFLSYNLKRRAKVVLVETWNELHEGTDVCDTKEFGRQYIELTAKYAKLFRDDVFLPRTGPFAGAGQVEWDADRADEKLGMTLKNFGDGLVEPFEAEGRIAWRTKQSEHGGKYVYFDLDDSFLFDEEGATLLVTIEYLDGGFGSFTSEYDGVDPKASVREGAFTSLGRSVACGQTGEWKTATLEIGDGRFANRNNGGDFRLVPTGGDLAIGRVTAKRGQPTRMPARGICAHRGASDTHPENTLAAFREAIRLGAQMIEFDVALTADGQLALVHDATVDRTTDGSGRVSDLTLAELKALDAGSWKGRQFEGERIPTLDEALAMMPENIWLNVHLKGNVELAEKVARRIVAHERLSQAFLACGAEAARAAKRVDPRIKICNMERQGNSAVYVKETIEKNADFIQLWGGKSVNPALTGRLRERGVRINYCCANEAEKVRKLFEAGVEFPLVDRVAEMLKVADQLGIERLRPVDRPPSRVAPGRCDSGRTQKR